MVKIMKQPVKVMQIVWSLDCGGLEKLVIDLASRLNHGVFNTCICCLDRLGDLENEAKSRGIEVVIVRKMARADFSLPLRLAYELKRRHIDIVHTHNMGPLLYGTLAARLANIPVLINTRHGRAKRSGRAFIWNMNNAMVAISEDAKIELFKWNHISPKKVSVIYNGIDIKRYSGNGKGDSIKKSFGINNNALIIGTVARLSPEKDQFTLLDAFARVINAIGDARLVIVGNGALRKDLEGYAATLGLSGKVHFLGFREDVAEILNVFNLFALSSLTEGISLTLLEAMAAGKPIVATNVGGNPEVIVDDETGFLVPPKDPVKMSEAILRILQNPALARKMGEEGRKRVEEKFNLDRMALEYEELYEECLSKKSGKN